MERKHHPISFAASVITVFGLAPMAVIAANSVNGVSFVDRAASGQVPLGNVRGGISAVDYDNDGNPDLVIADVSGFPMRLFHNVPDAAHLGNRKFIDVTGGSGLDDADGVNRGFGGVIVADYDNDGFSDIFFTGWIVADGQSDGLLYRNNGGNGTFTNTSIAAGVRSAGNHAESASWVDYDLDGFVDLFIANQQASVTPARLLHNNHNGTFSDASSILPPLTVPGHCYSHGWMDFDQDGYPDCFMMQNANPPALLHNVSGANGGRQLVNVAASAGYTHLGPAPMGFAAGDFDNDGDLDVCITDGVVGTYYRNNGDGTMTEITPFQTFFGWGTTWIDVDNDGDLDSYQAGSWGNANIDRLTLNLGDNQWQNASAALNTSALASQHAIQIDFNSDGRQDLITGNPGFPGQFISVYENISTTSGHWLKIHLRGDGLTSNTDAVGAVVRVHSSTGVRVREVISGSSTSETEDLRLHFGLGTAATVDKIEVLWPRRGSLAARTDVIQGPIAADRIITLEPAAAEPGDVNHDGLVDIDDLFAVINDWGGAGGPPDIDRNGIVDVDDLFLVINSWSS